MYQRTLFDQYCFPCALLPKTKITHGFQTGDTVKSEMAAKKQAPTAFLI